MSHFWAIYLLGVDDIYCVKYTLIIIIAQLLIGIITTFLSNKIIMINDKENISMNAFVIIIIICNMEKTITQLFNKLMMPLSNNEKRKISAKIITWIEKVFNDSTFEWKRSNPDNTQKEAIDTIYTTYMNVTWQITYIITTSINIIIFLLIAFYNSIIIGCVALIGCGLMIKFRSQFSNKLEKVDLNMTSKTKNIRLEIENQYICRSESLVNPIIKNTLSFEKYNPVVGHNKLTSEWDEREKLTLNMILINDFIKGIIIIILSLYYIDDIKMVIWLSMNGIKIFGLIDVISSFDQIKNLSSSRISSHIKMIDDLKIDCQYHNNVNEKTKTDEKIETITIQHVNHKLTDTLHLVSMSSFNIDFNVEGIILFDGHKGCGKSLTMDIIAGHYDNSVCNETMHINGLKTNDEFKSQIIQKNRFYVQQLVSDRFRRNRLNTISFTLRDLFTQMTHEKILKYLEHFDMHNKMPKKTDCNSMDILDICLGTNERSFSPGEMQALIMASQLHYAHLHNSQFLLLDELERNIDYETVKKIFDNIIIKKHINKHKRTIALITHNNELKMHLKQNKIVKQVFHFETIDNKMTFNVENISHKKD